MGIAVPFQVAKITQVILIPGAANNLTPVPLAILAGSLRVAADQEEEEGSLVQEEVMAAEAASVVQEEVVAEAAEEVVVEAAEEADKQLDVMSWVL